MTDTPERELIDYLRRCCEQAYSKSAPVMIPSGPILEAADTIEALISRVDKLEERLTNCFNIACDYTICERDAPRFTERPKGTLIWKGASDDNQ